MPKSSRFWLLDITDNVARTLRVLLATQEAQNASLLIENDESVAYSREQLDHHSIKRKVDSCDHRYRR
jgi:hypothetical protein